jgi:pantetheine-phosphate adenylyltransferase
MKTVLFPGSFDPFTNGHLDIVKRAILLFENVIVGVAAHSSKKCVFTLDERVELVKASVNEFTSVSVVPVHGLLVGFMKKNNLTLIVRGIRAVNDYEYEVQMASVNRTLDPQIETIFLPAGERASFISSSFIKQVAFLGGDVSQYVHESVVEMLKGKSNSP